MAMINDLKKFNEINFSRGYGKIGFENLIKNLSSENLDIIQNSMNFLKNELKNATQVPLAIDLGILESLYSILVKTSSFAKPCIMRNALRVLHFIANDFKGSQALVKNERLLKIILELMKTQKDLEEFCADVFDSLSAVPYVAKKLPGFVFQEFQNHLHVSSNERFFYALSNFISLNPTIFVRKEVVDSLFKNLHHPAALRCLSLILNCNDGMKIAHSMDIESFLVGILFDRHGEEIKTCTVMALRNCLTNKDLYDDHSKFPWQHLMAKLIKMSYNKINKELQRYCIQSLRIMSDVAVAKDRLCKVYKRELRNIPCMTNEAKEMKTDLLQWLEYRNYYLNEGNKYSKYFI